VDLGASAAISSVVIWNRTDCCSERLNDYWLFISNSPFNPSDTPASLQARAGVWSSHQTGLTASSRTVATPDVRGRYVRVQLSGAGYLSMAEVQVLGSLDAAINLAVGKPATQSSTILSATASRAVDGNTDGNWAQSSVTHTGLDANPWWQVDLGASATISSVVIWNRTDCCSDRLSDYWLFISDTPFNPSDTAVSLQTRAGVWSKRLTSFPNPSTAISVNASGRYVRVQPTSPTNLHLAEVQVFGSAL
jgi:hypothetical protein